METYKKAIDHAIKMEGGYVNNPNDPGGETKYGITKRTYPKLDIKNLTKEAAFDIYFKDFWSPYKFSKIKDEALAIKIFDTSVNTGPRRAFIFIQKACNNLGSKLKVDGDMGDRTVDAINSHDAKALLQEYKKMQESFYEDLVEKKPSLGVFLNGWRKRARS